MCNSFLLVTWLFLSLILFLSLPTEPKHYYGSKIIIKAVKKNKSNSSHYKMLFSYYFLAQSSIYLTYKRPAMLGLISRETNLEKVYISPQTELKKEQFCKSVVCVTLLPVIT